MKFVATAAVLASLTLAGTVSVTLGRERSEVGYSDEARVEGG
jgi:hypothetical protein